MASQKINRKAQAKSKALPPKRQVKRRRRSQSDEAGILLLAVIVLIALLSIAPEVAAICVIGVVPTLVMIFTDQHPLKSARLQCVALLNLAGVIPFAVKAYQMPGDWQIILVNAVTMVAMWGAAAVGWLLLYVGPIIAATVLQALAQDKLKNLAQQRADLIEQWGSEVLGEQEDKNAPKDNFIRPKKSR